MCVYLIYANSNLKISLTVAITYLLWHNQILKMHNLWAYLTLFLFLLFQLKEANSMLNSVAFLAFKKEVSVMVLPDVMCKPV